MSSVQQLRDFIRQRLTAAAEEIFTQVEKTIISYEEQLDAQRRMMGINWKPQIKLNRIGSELQRQSSDLQNPHVSVKEEAAAVQQERRSSHDQDEAESQWTDTLVKVISSMTTEEEQMEPEPPLTDWEPESLWIKEEEEEEEAPSPVFHFEQQEPEPLPTRQNQKHVCSGQEGQQLDQNQFDAMMETFTLQRRDLSEGEPRTEDPSFHNSPEAESKDQEGSSSTAPETQFHTDSRKGPVSCGVCGRLMKNKYDLKQHYMTHTGEKPFTCETCSKSFARRSQLNVHYRTHTGERPFTCPICKKRFFQIGHLNVHKNIHTGVRPFSCEACGKSFTRRYLLNIHRRSHTGERPFSWQSF